MQAQKSFRLAVCWILFALSLSGCATFGQRNAIRRTYENSPPSYSPDAKKVAFAERSMTGGYAVRHAGTGTPVFWSDFSEKVVLPDGSILEIIDPPRKSGDLEIYVMNTDGSEKANLTSNSADDGCPSWSPDGRKIVFCSMRNGNSEIYVMNADGGNQRRLTNHPARDICPSWSANGKKILFLSDRDGMFTRYAMSLRETEGADAEESYHHRRVSPGGAYLVQVGSFTDFQAALKLRKKLEKRGYPVSLSQAVVREQTLYRVRVGPYLTKAEARWVGDRLAREERLYIRIVKRRL